MAIDSRTLGGAIVRKSIEILASQNWTAPVNLAGNQVWLTGCAAGGGGGRGFSSGGFTSGGFGGSFCVKLPVIVTAGQVIAVTIPAGGSGRSGGGIGDGSVGGNLAFGSILTLKGGSGGTAARNAAYAASRTGISPAIPLSATNVTQPSMLTGFVAGATSMDNTSSDPTVICTGGAAGLFGNGGDGSVSGNATAPAANTGAGGGASRDAFGTSSDGSAGKLIIEWDEFL